MKLLKTVKKLVEETEILYNSACDSFSSLEEIETLEKNYKNSLKLLEMLKKENQNCKTKDTKKK